MSWVDTVSSVLTINVLLRKELGLWRRLADFERHGRERVSKLSWYKSGTGKFSAFLYLFRIDPYYLFISLIFVCIRRQSCYWSKQYNGFSRNLQENWVVLLNRSPNIIWPPWRHLQSFLNRSSIFAKIWLLPLKIYFSICQLLRLPSCPLNMSSSFEMWKMMMLCIK